MIDCAIVPHLREQPVSMIESTAVLKGDLDPFWRVPIPKFGRGFVYQVSIFPRWLLHGIQINIHSRNCRLVNQSRSQSLAYVTTAST